jgi:hypothetical protein
MKRLLCVTLFAAGLLAVAGCGGDKSGGGGAWKDHAALIAAADGTATAMCDCKDQDCAMKVEGTMPNPFGHKALDVRDKMKPEDKQAWEAARNKYVGCVTALAKK